MSVLYVTEQGACLRKSSERLLVVKDRKLLGDVPLIHVEQVVIVGNVQVSTPAVALLLRKQVDVVYLSSYGTYRGRLMATGSKFARLRHRQLHLVDDERASLELAQTLVVAKLSGQAALLQRYKTAPSGVRQAAQRAKSASSLDSLRGHEGSGGAAYFSGLRTLFPSDWGFRKRIYHPPTDRVNALLSLGYTLLLKDTTAAAQVVGLDPYIGVFHTLADGRPSLCLDLMEPFRPVVDDLVVQTVLGGTVPWKAFQTRKDGAMLLNDEARNRYLKAYEKRMAQRVPSAWPAKDEERTVIGPDPAPAGQTTVRRCIELQARSWARLVRGSARRLVPFGAQG